MPQSFGIVEEKLHEAEFFLNKLSEARRLSPESGHYFSAFVSSSRTITLAMQTSLSDATGFREWYKGAQEELRANVLAKQFLEIRNTTAHTGFNPLNKIDHSHLKESLKRQLSGDRSHELLLSDSESSGGLKLINAVEAARSYLIVLVRIVFDCYLKFKYVVDPQWYFTEEQFIANGKTFADALGEVGYPPCWVDFVPTEQAGWRMLRSSQPSCAINDIFQKYLDRTIYGPDYGETIDSLNDAQYQ